MSTDDHREEIADLRARTGAGMMDCKKALEEAGGDMEKAIEILRTRASPRPTSAPTARVGRPDHRPWAPTARSGRWSSSTARPTSWRATTSSWALWRTPRACPGRRGRDHRSWRREGRVAPTSVEETVKGVGQDRRDDGRAWPRSRAGGIVGHYLHFNGRSP